MIEINIAKDFTKTPGARTYKDGDFSGQEFYEKFLKNNFKLALEKHEKLKIILDGVEGYASSFLNEAFSLLGNEYNPDTVWDNIYIVSEETPKYAVKVKEAIYEKRK